MYMGDGTRVQVDFLEIVRLHLNTEKNLFFCKMWCSYPLLEEIECLYLFWIDLDIVFFWNWKS